MDWAQAIETNRTALTRIVAGLIAMVEMAAAGATALLPRRVHRAAVRILVPAESALRRLIVIAARGLVVNIRNVRPMPAGLKLTASGGGRAAFSLFDPLRRFDMRQANTGSRPFPRVLSFGAAPLVPLFQPQPDFTTGTPTGDDGMVSAETLGRRLQAIKCALANVPREAKRLARLTARRARIAKYKFRPVLRSGPPPGHRQEPKDDVDRILSRCHELAREAVGQDTS
jgi:hypothetical protein